MTSSPSIPGVAERVGQPIQQHGPVGAEHHPARVAADEIRDGRAGRVLQIG